jgi:hypothetical protein
MVESIGRLVAILRPKQEIINLLVVEADEI